jgi:Rps23 Pro-64 3,4-dihydroxylase Tpa1-like proline 4-hydroxylase
MTGHSEFAHDVYTPVAEPVLDISRADGFFEFDRADSRALGQRFHDRYVNASPYPHIVFDNLISADVLRQVNREFPSQREGRFADSFSMLKTGYRLEQIRSAYINDLLSAFNSPAFLNFLEAMTGIRGLIPDARFTGGGLHETRRGGHLSIHADFNIHAQARLRRRLNLILFLNEVWEDDWGGNLELWDQSMRACRHSIKPTLGRAVIFNTDGKNFHGHPDPLNTPPDVTRRSIALYYYTVPSGFTLPHTTVFRPRPGTADVRPTFSERIVQTLRLMLGRNEET